MKTFKEIQKTLMLFIKLPANKSKKINLKTAFSNKSNQCLN